MKLFSMESWNLMIRTQLLGLLGLLALGYLLVLAALQLTAGKTHTHTDQASVHLFPAALKMEEAESAFSQMNRSYRDSVVMEDHAALDSADKEALTLLSAVEQVRLNVATRPALQSQAESLGADLTAFCAESRTAYLHAVSDEADPERLDAMHAQLLALTQRRDALGARMKALNAGIAQDFHAELVEVDSLTLRAQVVGQVMLIAAALACVLGWLGLQAKILKPLERLAVSMRDIAEGEGDLTHRLAIHGTNELDQVGLSFNTFIARVEQIVLRVLANATELAVSAGDLDRIAQESAAQSRMHQDQTTNITSSMSEIAGAGQEISRNTEAAAKAAEVAEQNAQSGGKTIEGMLGTMQNVLSANQQTARRVETLGAASSSIGKVLGVIKDIAGQTNLLALNASIESAHAGIHGKGFAVVADEVRRLAERTRQATDEIEDAIRAIQNDTSEVIEATQQSVQGAESGVISANSAGQVLASIIRGSEAVQKRVSEIAGASKEQSNATSSVNENLSEIASIIKRAGDSSAQSVQACGRLSTLAQELLVLVDSFKVGPGSAVGLTVKSSGEPGISLIPRPLSYP